MDQLQQTFLEAASIIGSRLCRDALWSGERCNWLGDSMEFINGNWPVVHRSFGPDLYAGTSGIALFLARLYQLTRERLYRVTAQGAIAQALSQLDTIGPHARIALYSGHTGIAYALLQLGEIFDSEPDTDQALQIIQLLREDDPAQQGLDVISGSAGAIPALLLLYRKHPQEFIMDLAHKHAAHLLDTARRSDDGWSWNTIGGPEADRSKDLNGFSHGAAGIGWALLELWRATGEEKYLEAAQEAFRYERHWFSQEYENWPDLRSFNDPAQKATAAASYTVAWCHGAPGIGLSRLRAYQILDQEIYLREAEAALRTTARMLVAPFTGQNYSLCHGVSGNADLLIYASRVLGSSAATYKATAEHAGAEGIKQFQQTNLPWPCGVPGGGETPGLMLGLAGIGYFYLRLYDPARTPSINIIEIEAESK